MHIFLFILILLYYQIHIRNKIFHILLLVHNGLIAILFASDNIQFIIYSLIYIIRKISLNLALFF